MNSIRRRISLHNPLIKYFIYSVLAAVIDGGLVWLLISYFDVSLVYANTTGVILGFFIHYVLASKSIFNAAYGLLGFLIYIGTFVVGLFLAGGLISLCYQYVFYFLSRELNFLFSKGVSLIVPFFVLYFMRKYLYHLVEKTAKHKGDVAL
ncbi:GtrA family protein [Cellulosilyticum sp. I15G10I2]|uniref:GtrA family protein n=1 Tax=Cellulosilyticum sp. I15G10I2 TaxID=1892843 RepID=UPI00085CAC8A|nr:GtrA family protein [Cellulosilyticum sp. I15G10I2]